MKPYNIEGYRRLAERRLPRAVFDFVDGGAEDETTVRANRDGFASLRLVPRVHEDHAPLELSTTLCGQPLSMPVMLSPIGNVGMVHPDGDRGAAIVAARRGVIMLMSGAASYGIEEVAADADPAPWYQLYTWESRDYYGRLIDRAAAAGFRGLVVTVDVPASSRRERDIVNAFTHPPRLTRRNALGIIRHPVWTTGVLRHRRVVVKLFAEENPPTLQTFVREAKRSGASVASRLTRATWDDLAWVRERWDGPFGIKGIVDPTDAERAVDVGADVVYVSNHGGRQLDGAIGAVEALAATVDVVGDRAEVVLDGGVRRGTDVLKALCLGARAVSIGRPWVYGLAADGAAGVDAVLEAFRSELAASIVQLGQPCVRKLDRSYLASVGGEGLALERASS